LPTKVRQSLGANLHRQKKLRLRAHDLAIVVRLATVILVLLTLSIPLFVRIQRRSSRWQCWIRPADACDVTTKSPSFRDVQKSTVENFSRPRHWKRGKKPGPTKAGELSPKSFYDLAAGEVRVTVHRQGETYRKSIIVDRDLAAAMRQANNIYSGADER